MIQHGATGHQKLLAALLGASLLAACAAPQEPMAVASSGTVIRNVTVVDTRDGVLLPGQTLLLDGGKIVRIVSGAVRVEGTAREIDASGKFVVPGYLDMHTHALLTASKPAAVAWPMLVANGITGVREMAGSAQLIQLAHALNADSAAGKLTAPEILAVPGDILAAPLTPEQAVQRVRQQKQMGADFIKVAGGNHDGTLAVLDEAHIQGLTVSGHMPLALQAATAADAGWRAIEHLGSGLGMVLGCSTAEDAVRSALLHGEGAAPPPPAAMPLAIVSPMLFRAADAPFYQKAMDGYSEEKCTALARRFAQRGTWQVPTLIRLRTAAFSTAPQYREDPALVHVDKDTRALWERLARQYETTVPTPAAATFQRYYGLQRQLVGLLARNGVKMMAGSDLGGIWVIPGVSLHQEFGELAAAGLTPLQILQMTTLNGAEFLHREAEMGTVEAGKNADLVLLSANPLADVSNLSRISAVVLKGRYLDQKALDALKVSSSAP
jgi:imidazolonepropionase-like amidohydrolase